eukprot:TRINITY_DN6151_c0_g1_i1.p1 TRINITY_DN6151_c0_g1~~TRINITY_DN6151_c0_g1_i1.p1  ORF type:complete len:708 (+),score=69.40 TRINITY_DN6151_c0_g1_i1:31-2154(+)
MGDFDAALQQYFKAAASFPENVENVLCSVSGILLYYGSNGFEVFTRAGQRYTVSCIPWNSRESGSPKLPHAVIRLVANPANALVLAITQRTTYLLRIPQRLPEPGTPVSCEYRQLFPSLTFSTKVLEARWHPLSEFHVALLTDEGILYLIDIRTATPEQTFHLTPPRNSPQKPFDVVSPSLPCCGNGGIANTLNAGRLPVSFDFAGSVGWAPLSVLFLFEDGDVFCLCPVVPWNCQLPVPVLQSLPCQSGSAEITKRRWISELCQGPGGHPSLVRTGSSSSILPAQAVGPLQLGGPNKHSGAFAGIEVLTTQPPVIVLASRLPSIDILALVSGVYPPALLDQADTPAPIVARFVDRVPLADGGAGTSKHGKSYILKDDLRPESFFLHHPSSGLLSVELPAWLVVGDSSAGLSETRASPITGSIGNTQVVGSALVRDASGATWLVALTGKEHRVHPHYVRVDQRITRKPLSTPLPPGHLAAPKSGRSSEEMQRLLDVYGQLASMPPLEPLLPATATAEDPDDGVTVLLRSLRSELSQWIIEYSEAIDAVHTSSLSKWQTTRKRIEDATVRIRQLEGSQNALRQRSAAAWQRHQLLVERAKTLEIATARGISDAEVRLHSDLKRIQNEWEPRAEQQLARLESYEAECTDSGATLNGNETRTVQVAQDVAASTDRLIKECTTEIENLVRTLPALPAQRREEPQKTAVSWR